MQYTVFAMDSKGEKKKKKLGKKKKREGGKEEKAETYQS